VAKRIALSNRVPFRPLPAHATGREIGEEEPSALQFLEGKTLKHWAFSGGPMDLEQLLEVEAMLRMHWKVGRRKGLCTATLNLLWFARAASADSRLEEFEFGLPGSLKKIEAREAYGQREAAWPGATWVDIQDAVAPVRLWLVRVAANDYLKAFGF
jgi:hypothetical protein